MADDLIELVRQRKVLYDTKCKQYKDHLIRNAAWEEIAEILKEPVNKCKDDWAKLRNAFASALKRRRNKKSGQAAVAFVPWKYEESMGFLLPYMECRNTTTNVMLPPQSPTSDDSLDDRLPASPSSTGSRETSLSSEGFNQKAKLQDLYDLMKSSQDLRRQKQNARQDMDETDLFFLSMSKALKALPKLEQTKIKLDLHTAISQAEIRQLEHRDKIFKTPITITSQRIIQSTLQDQFSPFIQTTNHSPAYTQLTTRSQSSPKSSSQQSVNIVSNTGEFQRFIHSNPNPQSYIQSTADVHSSTYTPPTIRTQSATIETPTYIHLPTSNVVSDDLKAYYDNINFADDDIENDK